MAIQPKLAYPGQTDAADTAYPYGKAQNVATPGDTNGTPLESAWLNDLWGFQQALLGAAGVVPSGTPDKVGASDYLTALRKVISNLVTPGIQTERRIPLSLGARSDAADGWHLQGDQGNPVVWRNSHAESLSSVLFPLPSVLPDGGKLDRVTLRYQAGGGYVAGGVLIAVAVSDPTSGALTLLASTDVEPGTAYSEAHVEVDPVVTVSWTGPTHYIFLSTNPVTFTGNATVSGLRVRYTPATLV